MTSDDGDGVSLDDGRKERVDHSLTIVKHRHQQKESFLRIDLLFAHRLARLNTTLKDDQDRKKLPLLFPVFHLVDLRW
jgi:hypothetical protein